MKERFYKEVPNVTNFLLDLDMESGMEKTQIIIVGFEINKIYEPTPAASTFCVMIVLDCYCKIGSEFYPEKRMNINYGTNNYNEVFKTIFNFNQDYYRLPHKFKPYLTH